MGKYLTIGIPTWNRAALLFENLTNLIRQLQTLPPAERDKVEILISDNASTDDTVTICKKIENDHSELVRVRSNGANIGFSRNIDALVRDAHGRHVLLLSDDDGLEEDAISILLTELSKHPTAECAFVRATAYSADLQRSVDPKALEALRRQHPQSSPSHFFSEIRSYYKHRRTLTNVCISGCVFRRQAWESVSLEIGLKSGSIQLYAALRLQVMGGGIICVERPGVKYRGANASESYVNVRAGGWKSGFPFVYPFDAISAIRSCKDYYPRDIYRSFYLICVRDMIQTLIDAKAQQFPVNWDYFYQRLQSDLDPDCASQLANFIKAIAKLDYHLILLFDRPYKLLRKAYYFLLRIR